MSRQELAEAVNAYVWQRHGRQEHLDHTDIGKLERGRIRWPGEQRREALRVVLGVASDSEIGLYLNRRAAPSGPPDTLVDRLATAGGDGDEVERRDLLAAGGAAAAGVVLPARTSTDRLAGVVAVLTGRVARLHLGDAEDMPLVEAAVRVKRCYQAGRYRQVVDGLPGMLAVARTADEASVGESRLDVAVADAYQTTCSVLLKLGEVGLALLAADRSVAAAHRSGDPVAIGASSRALAHALASNGHPGRAVTVALAAARQLERARGLSTAPALAVYGALLLRAATLAAWGEDRDTALGTLTEAQGAAERLDGDDNTRWTYFCTGNVQLHRVHVAVSLGDAGQSVEHARQVDPGLIQLDERRASFFLDLARAFTQWGKYDKAYDAVCAAERAAPQEVADRPASRDLVVDLHQRSPPSLRRHLRHLADRIGAAAWL